MLQIYNWNKPAVVEIDALNQALGGVLFQKGKDGELYPIAFFLIKYLIQEVNYDIYNKKLFAVVKALKEWRPELKGALSQFTIYIDYKNL